MRLVKFTMPTGEENYIAADAVVQVHEVFRSRSLGGRRLHRDHLWLWAEGRRAGGFADGAGSARRMNNRQRDIKHVGGFIDASESVRSR